MSNFNVTLGPNECQVRGKAAAEHTGCHVSHWLVGRVRECAVVVEVGLAQEQRRKLRKFCFSATCTPQDNTRSTWATRKAVFTGNWFWNWVMGEWIDITTREYVIKILKITEILPACSENLRFSSQQRYIVSLAMARCTLGGGLQTLRWHLTVPGEILAAYSVVHWSSVFWDVIPCSLLDVYRLSKEICISIFEADKISLFWSLRQTFLHSFYKVLLNWPTSSVYSTYFVFNGMFPRTFASS